MNSQDFLTLNLVGAGAFLVWYLLSRGGPQAPAKLNLKAKDTAPTVLEPLAEAPPAISSDHPVSEERAVVEAAAPAASPTALPYRSRRNSAPRPEQVKSLNVMFNYNGHSWDAYEVLGVPAGSSIRLVTDAYQKALRKCDPESVGFLETAYQAILHKK